MESTALFDRQILWDTLRDIGYEGDLTKLTFQKPLFSPHWKYLVHVLLHYLSPKSTAWDQFGQAIASALVGLATNRPFNFSHMIFDGMLTHIDNGSPFLMYPRFVQLFLNKQLEDLPKPQSFLPGVLLPPKVFTFMAKKSVKFSGQNTPLTAHILEVAQAVRDEADAPSDNEHSDSAHTKTPFMNHLNILLQLKELLHYLILLQGKELFLCKVLLQRKILLPCKLLLILIQIQV